MFSSRRHRGPIGIDLGGRTIRAVQLSGRPGHWRTEAVAEVPRRADSDLPTEALRLAGVLGRQGFTGQSAVLAVPDAALLTAILDLPPRSSGAPVEQIALAELARAHRREPATLEMACWDLPAPARPGDTVQVMAAACAHTDAGTILDAFENAGFEVRALDVRALAVARACRALWAPGDSMTAVLDIGWESVLLSVVGGDVVVYERLLEACDLHRLHAMLVEREGLPSELAEQILADGGAAPSDSVGDILTEARHAIENHAQTLSEQLSLSLSYTAHRYPGRPVGAILLTGEGGGMPGLDAMLSTRLEAPARAVTAADLADRAPKNAALIGALGLAAWTAEGQP
jgi:type IV pilus assembly protein PilM